MQYLWLFLFCFLSITIAKISTLLQIHEINKLSKWEVACLHDSATISCECWFMRKGKTSGPGEKPLKPTYGIDATWFEPGPRCWEASVLTTGPSLAFKCPVSNSSLPLLPWNTNAGYFREEPCTSNQHPQPLPPPPPPPPPSLIMIFFSSGSVQNVVGLNTTLHVNPD